MKIKTDKEIGLIACEYADHNQKSRPQIAWVLFDVKEAFKAAYTQAQKDMIDGASEGFYEWAVSNGWIKDQDCDWWINKSQYISSLVYERIWQAATISMKAKVETLKQRELEYQSDLKKLQKSNDTLKKENEELKYYKEQWQSIAGKANLQELMSRLEEAEEVIEQNSSIHPDQCSYVLFGGRRKCDCIIRDREEYMAKYGNKNE